MVPRTRGGREDGGNRGRGLRSALAVISIGGWM